MPRSFEISNISFCPFRKETRIMSGIYVGIIIFICLNSDHDDFVEGKTLPICQGKTHRLTEDFPPNCPGKKRIVEED